MKPIPKEATRALFKYSPESGQITWAADCGRFGRIKAGSQAGYRDRRGYLIVQIGREKYFAHRVAWLMYYGYEPDGDIDHINRNKSDNRITNLRDVSRTVNKQNQEKAHKNSTTGTLGVSPYRGKYRARIVVNGKEKQIGTFVDVESAKAAYIEYKRKFHEGCTL